MYISVTRLHIRDNKIFDRFREQENFSQDTYINDLGYSQYKFTVYNRFVSIFFSRINRWILLQVCITWYKKFLLRDKSTPLKISWSVTRLRISENAIIQVRYTRKRDWSYNMRKIHIIGNNRRIDQSKNVCFLIES